jgi:pimeloyl-ACP methyl ester carboxylesterase
VIFVLLHAGAHGSWSWERVAPRLQARGHSVICPTLPLDDPSAGVDRWADVVCEHLVALNASDLVIVGHSATGLVLPVIASMRAVARMVFVCAVVPLPGRRHVECLGERRDAITLPRHRIDFDGQGRMIVPWETARDYYYHDCEEHVARAAWSRLCPFAQNVWKEISPIDAWPETPSSYLMGNLDRSLSTEYSRRVSSEMLGESALELSCGHSPMLSCPDELAAALDLVARP